MDSHEQDDLDLALKELEGYNKTSARVIRMQLETLEEEAVTDVRRILSAAIEQNLADCRAINTSKSASCNSIANNLEAALSFEEYEIELGLVKLPLGVKSSLECISSALRMASRTNFRKEVSGRNLNQNE